MTNGYAIDTDLSAVGVADAATSAASFDFITIFYGGDVSREVAAEAAAAEAPAAAARSVHFIFMICFM